MLFNSKLSKNSRGGKLSFGFAASLPAVIAASDSDKIQRVGATEPRTSDVSNTTFPDLAASAHFGGEGSFLVVKDISGNFPLHTLCLDGTSGDQCESWDPFVKIRLRSKQDSGTIFQEFRTQVSDAHDDDSMVPRWTTYCDSNSAYGSSWVSGSCGNKADYRLGAAAAFHFEDFQFKAGNDFELNLNIMDDDSIPGLTNADTPFGDVSISGGEIQGLGHCLKQYTKEVVLEHENGPNQNFHLTFSVALCPFGWDFKHQHCLSGEGNDKPC